MPQHQYLCVPAARFHARFFLQSVSSGCTLTQSPPQSLRTRPDPCHHSVTSGCGIRQVLSVWKKLMMCHLTLWQLLLHWTASRFTSKSWVEISSVRSRSSCSALLSWRLTITRNQLAFFPIIMKAGVKYRSCLPRGSLLFSNQNKPDTWRSLFLPLVSLHVSMFVKSIEGNWQQII